MPTLTPEQRRRHGAVAAAPAADALGGRAALAPLMHPPQGAARRVLSAPLLSLPAVSDFCGNGGEARGGGAQGVVQASRIPDSLPVCPSPPAAAARGAGRGDAPGCGSCLGPCRPPAKRRRTRGGAGRRARGTPRRPSCHQWRGARGRLRVSGGRCRVFSAPRARRGPPPGAICLSGAAALPGSSCPGTVCKWARVAPGQEQARWSCQCVRKAGTVFGCGGCGQAWGVGRCVPSAIMTAGLGCLFTHRTERAP